MNPTLYAIMVQGNETFTTIPADTELLEEDMRQQLTKVDLCFHFQGLLCSAWISIGLQPS